MFNILVALAYTTLGIVIAHNVLKRRAVSGPKAVMYSLLLFFLASSVLDFSYMMLAIIGNLIFGFFCGRLAAHTSEATTRMMNAKIVAWIYGVIKLFILFFVYAIIQNAPNITVPFAKALLVVSFAASAIIYGAKYQAKLLDKVEK